MPLKYQIKKKSSKKIKTKQKNEESAFHLQENIQTEEAKNVLQDYSSGFFNEEFDFSVTETLIKKNRCDISQWKQRENKDNPEDEEIQKLQNKVFQRSKFTQQSLPPFKVKEEKENKEEEKKNIVPKTEILVIDDEILEKRKISIKSTTSSIKFLPKNDKKIRRHFCSKIVSMKPDQLDHHLKTQPLHSNSTLAHTRMGLKSNNSKSLNNSNSQTKLDYKKTKRYLDFNTIMKKYKQRAEEKETSQKRFEEKKQKSINSGYIINNYIKKKNHCKMKAIQAFMRQNTEQSHQRLNKEYSLAIRKHLLKERIKTTMQTTKIE